MDFLRTADPDRGTRPGAGPCFLYVLPCAYEDLLKLGFSRDPLQRLSALQPRYYEFFDLDRAFLVETETERDARRLELESHRALRAHNAPEPLLIRSRAGGRREWYRGAYAQLRARADALAERGHNVHPLRPWLRHALAARNEVLFPWASALLQALQGEPERLDDPSLHALRRRVLDMLDAHIALDLDPTPWLPDAWLPWYRCAGTGAIPSFDPRPRRAT